MLYLPDKIRIMLSTTPRKLFFRFIACMALYSLCSCKPNEPLQLRQIKNVKVELNQEPFIRAEAVIHNPNKMRVKLRKADVEVRVDGKHAASIQQDFNLIIPAESDFTLPLEVKVNLREMGFLDTVLSVLGGRKFEVQYTGMLWLTYNGVRIKLPVRHREEVRVRL